MALPKREDVTRSGSVVVFLSILIVIVIVAGVYLLRDYEDRNTYIPERIEDIREFLGLNNVDYNFTPQVAGISTKVDGQYSKFNIPVDYSVRTQVDKSSIETKSLKNSQQLPDLNNLTQIKIPVLDYKNEITPVKNNSAARHLISSENSLAVINNLFPKKGIVMLCEQRLVSVSDSDSDLDSGPSSQPKEQQGNCPDVKTVFMGDVFILQDRFGNQHLYKAYEKKTLQKFVIGGQIPDGSTNKMFLAVEDGASTHLIKTVLL